MNCAGIFLDTLLQDHFKLGHDENSRITCRCENPKRFFVVRREEWWNIEFPWKPCAEIPEITKPITSCDDFTIRSQPPLQSTSIIYWEYKQNCSICLLFYLLWMRSVNSFEVFPLLVSCSSLHPQSRAQEIEITIGKYYREHELVFMALLVTLVFREREKWMRERKRKDK